MALEDILMALEREAEEEINGILSRAKDEAKRIIGEAEGEVGRIRDAQLARRALTLRGEQARILNDARLYKKKELIKAKEDYIDKAFTKAREELKKMVKTPSYKDVFRSLAKEVMSAVSGKAEVSVNKNDAKLAKEVLDELKVDYVLKPGLNCLGGLKVTSAGGRITHVNTLDSRLEKARQVLKPQVAEILFGSK